MITFSNTIKWLHQVQKLLIIWSTMLISLLILSYNTLNFWSMIQAMLLLQLLLVFEKWSNLVLYGMLISFKLQENDLKIFIRFTKRFTFCIRNSLQKSKRKALISKWCVPKMTENLLELVVEKSKRSIHKKDKIQDQNHDPWVLESKSQMQ